MELSGTAYGRGVLALDFDLGVLLGLRDQSLAGLFTVPLPDASSLDPYFRLNRLDVGDSLGISGLHASLAVAGLGSVSVDDVHLGVVAGGRVALADRQGDGRLKLSDVKALRAADPANWFKQLAVVTPSAKFDAGFTVSVDSAIQVGGQSFTAVFGNPIVNLVTDQLFVTDEQGVTRFQTPAVTLDIALTAAQRDTLLSVLDQLQDAGDGALSSDFLTTRIPGLDKSLSELFTVSGSESVLSSLFHLTTAAQTYFNGTNLALAGNAAGPDTATIRGLAAALNEALARAAAMPFLPEQPEWAGAKLAFTDFRGLDLRGFNFVGADLHGANFAGADLSGVNFAGANLAGATFATYDGGGHVTSGAVLREVNFRGATVTGLSFAGLDLRGASFADTDLSGIDFSQASLIGADFLRSVVDHTTEVAGALLHRIAGRRVVSRRRLPASRAARPGQRRGRSDGVPARRLRLVGLGSVAGQLHQRSPGRRQFAGCRAGRRDVCQHGPRSSLHLQSQVRGGDAGAGRRVGVCSHRRGRYERSVGAGQADAVGHGPVGLQVRGLRSVGDRFQWHRSGGGQAGRREVGRRRSGRRDSVRRDRLQRRACWPKSAACRTCCWGTFRAPIWRAWTSPAKCSIT